MAQANPDTQSESKKRTGAVKKSAPADKKKAQSGGLGRYIRETRGEMRKVTWPTREEAQRLTIIVLIVTLVFALFLGGLDYIWSNMVRFLIDLIIGA